MDTTFVDCLNECDSVLSPADRCYLSYLFGALLTANELRGKDGLVPVYNLFKGKIGPERSQPYLYILKEHANCYNERKKLVASCQAMIQPPYDHPKGSLFRMRERIVGMDKELDIDHKEFTLLVEHVLAKGVIKSNADNFPASDSAKHIDFYMQLEKQQAIASDSYEAVLAKELDAIGRKDLSAQFLSAVSRAPKR